jgi:hypothetical protein
MSKGLTVLAMALVLVFCASMVWSADLDRDRLRDGGGDGVPKREQLQDGSCKTDVTTYISAPAPRQDRDRLRDGGGDGVPDKERVRDRLRDGSCLA